MSSPDRRVPWYRIHLVTHVALMVIGAALLWIQSLLSSGQLINSRLYYGWPLGYQDPFVFSRLPYLEFSWFALCVNSVVGIALLLGTGFLLEVLIRRIGSRLQFSLTSALVVVIAAAIMLGERYAGWSMYKLAQAFDLRPALLSGYPWYCAAPIYFAIFCTLCTVSWLLFKGIARRFECGGRRKARLGVTCCPSQTASEAADRVKS